jgi:hypothetical protein
VTPVRYGSVSVPDEEEAAFPFSSELSNDHWELVQSVNIPAEGALFPWHDVPALRTADSCAAASQQETKGVPASPVLQSAASQQGTKPRRKPVAKSSPKQQSQETYCKCLPEGWKESRLIVTGRPPIRGDPRWCVLAGLKMREVMNPGLVTGKLGSLFFGWATRSVADDMASFLP